MTPWLSLNVHTNGYMESDGVTASRFPVCLGISRKRQRWAGAGASSPKYQAQIDYWRNWISLIDRNHSQSLHSPPSLPIYLRISRLPFIFSNTSLHPSTNSTIIPSLVIRLPFLSFLLPRLFNLFLPLLMLTLLVRLVFAHPKSRRVCLKNIIDLMNTAPLPEGRLVSFALTRRQFSINI